RRRRRCTTPEGSECKVAATWSGSGTVCGLCGHRHPPPCPRGTSWSVLRDLSSTAVHSVTNDSESVVVTAKVVLVGGGQDKRGVSKRVITPLFSAPELGCKRSPGALARCSRLALEQLRARGRVGCKTSATGRLAEESTSTAPGAEPGRARPTAGEGRQGKPRGRETEREREKKKE
ncbi:unnamed protein product, partial [Prorocentrum cordatum]